MASFLWKTANSGRGVFPRIHHISPSHQHIQHVFPTRVGSYLTYKLGVTLAKSRDRKSANPDRAGSTRSSKGAGWRAKPQIVAAHGTAAPACTIAAARRSRRRTGPLKDVGKLARSGAWRAWLEPAPFLPRRVQETIAVTRGPMCNPKEGANLSRADSTRSSKAAGWRPKPQIVTAHDTAAPACTIAAAHCPKRTRTPDNLGKMRIRT